MTADDSGPRRFEILGRIAGWDPKFANAARRWLDNFDESDQTTATALLDAFVYIDNSSVDAIFGAAFGSLASVVCTSDDYSVAIAQWEDFLRSVLVTFPTGETPNPTDSGYAFQRRVRQVMEIDQSQIVEPGEAFHRLRTSSGHVVFVDDIVGSGDQFISTWQRPYPSEGTTGSFADISSQISAHFVPLFATLTGVERIRSQVPTLNLMPIHQLGPEYSAHERACMAWADIAYEEGVHLVEEYSRRARIPNPWGYRGLGLCLGFEHGIPDATLPIFYWEQHGWRPLVRQR